MAAAAATGGRGAGGDNSNEGRTTAKGRSRSRGKTRVSRLSLGRNRKRLAEARQRQLLLRGDRGGGQKRGRRDDGRRDADEEMVALVGGDDNDDDGDDDDGDDDSSSDYDDNEPPPPLPPPREADGNAGRPARARNDNRTTGVQSRSHVEEEEPTRKASGQLPAPSSLHASASATVLAATPGCASGGNVGVGVSVTPGSTSSSSSREPPPPVPRRRPTPSSSRKAAPMGGELGELFDGSGGGGGCVATPSSSSSSRSRSVSFSSPRSSSPLPAPPASGSTISSFRSSTPSSANSASSASSGPSVPRCDSEGRRTKAGTAALPPPAATGAQPPGGEGAEEERRVGGAVAPPPQPRKRPRRSSEEEEEEGTAAPTSTRSTSSSSSSSSTPPPPRHDFRTSAYVQHLAEMCHSVLADVRWRVAATTSDAVAGGAGSGARGGGGRSVLAWENGDDLSAVGAFANLWDGRVGGMPPGREEEEEGEKEEGGAVGGVGDDCIADADVKAVAEAEAEQGRALARSLHLYSRLFVRRGPWFSLDDLYFRYYCHERPERRRTFSSRAAASGEVTPEEEGESGVEAGTGAEEPSTSTLGQEEENQGGRTDLRDSSAEDGSDATPKPSRPMSRQQLTERHRSALRALFSDVLRLYRMGLIRTFESEAECGIVAGNVTETGAGVLLTAEDRRAVLGRLGGGPGKGTGLRRGVSRDSCGRSSSSSFDKTSGRADGTRGMRRGGDGNAINLIWRQMSTQRSVISCAALGPKTDRSSGTLLPVRPHVNDVVWRKLAKRILGSISEALEEMNSNDCSNRRSEDGKKSIEGGFPARRYRPGGKSGSSGGLTGYARRADLERFVATLNEAWSDAASDMLDLDSDLDEAMNCNVDSKIRGKRFQRVFACVRLREAPLLALRRAARLYLCAGGGPGSMRSEGGTNGWVSVLEQPATPDLGGEYLATSCFPEIRRLIRAATLPSWHGVTYPGLSARLSLKTFPFASAFVPLPACAPKGADCDSGVVAKNTRVEPTLSLEPIAIHETRAQIFCDNADFHRWELCAELRATIDYMIELNETTHYLSRRFMKENARKRRQDEKDKAEKDENRHSNTMTGECPKSDGTHSLKGKDEESNDEPLLFPPVLDRHQVLTSDGRRALIGRMITFDVLRRASSLSKNGISASTLGVCHRQVVDHVHRKVEANLRALDSDPHSRECEKDTASAEERTVYEDVDDPFENDAERVICAISLIGMHTLLLRFQTVSVEEMVGLACRPWLRHLSWESVLAYVLWDCVPILEKRGCYDLAVALLETILLGRENIDGGIDNRGDPGVELLDAFVRGLLSRRVRGKSYERLLIDRGHISRKESVPTAKLPTAKRGNGMSNSKETAPGRKKLKKAIALSRAEQNPTNDEEQQSDSPSTLLTEVQKFCMEAIRREGRNGSIPFSSIRNLARRMKVPLAETICRLGNAEMAILKIRSENEGSMKTRSSDASKRGTKATGYEEWTPKTDFSVANSISHETADGVGKRCSFVGWEDASGKGMANMRSLNVEELAMEEYASGRLPKEDVKEIESVKGGWIGWHDEGGHVRALFRILCSKHLLLGNVDEGHIHTSESAVSEEMKTIFLTPYQGTPLDLHVGHLLSVQCAQLDLGGNGRLSRGFYERRRAHIDAFLRQLERLDCQQISDLVYESIMERADRSAKIKVRARDVLLSRDMKEVRTLGFIAAGFGGKMLAAMFRCLCFDYRHYSGGLPDLLLARAIYEEPSVSGTEQPDKKLVDLGDWIGEAFSKEEVQDGKVSDLAKILMDRDDEFLGCSKIGDSTGRWRQSTQQKSHRIEGWGEKGICADDPRPPKLMLSHDNRSIHVECMFVEVKSANDRLDARQEDWLNVLDGVGCARVCKFSKKKGR